MTLTIPKPIMLAALKKIAPAFGGNNILPILSNVLVEVTPTHTKFTATNMGLTISEKIETGGENLSFLMPYAETVNIFNVIQDEAVIRVDKNITIKSGKDIFKLGKSEDVTHFPATKTSAELFTVDVDWQFFYSLSLALKSTRQIAAEYVLNNISIEFEKGKVNVIGLDGYQMYHSSIQIDNSHPHRIAVDGNFAKAVSGFGYATVTVSENNITAVLGNTTVTSILADVKFPQTKVFFENKTDDNVFINRKNMEQALKNVLAFRDNAGLYITRLQFIEGGIKISYNNAAYEREFNGEVEAKHNVEIDAICLNAKQLLLSLSQLPDECEMLNIAVTMPNKPCYITHENTRLILMSVTAA